MRSRTEIDYSTISPMTPLEKLNPLGTHLLHHYYSTSFQTDIRGKKTPKITKNFYNLNNPKDIPIIRSCESATKEYGMIIVASDKHRTAVVVKGNNVVILESLGTKTNVGKNSISQISLAINNIPGKRYNIFAPAQVRQADSVSCGTDAFMSLKEALRLKDLFHIINSQRVKELRLSNNDIMDLDEKNDPFYANTSVSIKEFPHLPEEIVKYSQAFSKITKLPAKSRNTAIKINSPLKIASTPFAETSEILTTEKLSEYAERHKETRHIQIKVTSLSSFSTDSESPLSISTRSSSASFQSISPLREISEVTSPTLKDLPSSASRHSTFSENSLSTISEEFPNSPGTELEIKIVNSAVEKRRQKHKEITEELIRYKSLEDIDRIIKRSSGIDLIMYNIEKLNDLFSLSSLKSVNSEKLIEEYIRDEKHKQLNEETSKITDSRHSLLEVALSIFQTRESSRDISPNESFISPKRSSSPELEKRKLSPISQNVDRTSRQRIIKKIATRSLDALTLVTNKENQENVISRSHGKLSTKVLIDRSKTKTGFVIK